jgi:hypothetical protein
MTDPNRSAKTVEQHRSAYRQVSCPIADPAPRYPKKRKVRFCLPAG